MRTSHHEEERFGSAGFDLGGYEQADGSAEASSSAGFEAQAEPSRVLFVRNVSPGSSDEDITALFKVRTEARRGLVARAGSAGEKTLCALP